MYRSNREILEETLAVVEMRIANGEVLLTRQRSNIAERQRRGDDTAQARDLLARMEDAHRARIADRERLSRQLAGRP